jgi:prolyl oligopeptidase
MKPKLIALLSILTILLTLSCEKQRPAYPAAKKVDATDDYHGVKVADPYRWLEDSDAEETIAWVEAQNKLTFDYIRSSPAYEKTKARLTELWNYPKYSNPIKKGGRYFFSKNDGLQNQSVVYMQQSLDSEPAVVIDPNKLSEDGTIALSKTSFSEDGKFLAYGLSAGGSDRQEFKIRDIDAETDFEEVIKWCKFSGIAWKHDNSGFYYNRFPEPISVAKEDQNNYNRVYWHKLGTKQSKDILVFEQPEAKELGFWPSITDDGKYLVLHVSHGTDPKNRIYFRKVKSNGPFIKLLDKADANYSLIHNVGSTFYFKTNLEAPRGRIVAIDLKRLQRKNWKEILPEQEDVISFVKVVNNQFVISFMHDAYEVLKIFNLDGAFIREIELPAIGSVYGISGNYNDSEMFISFTSFLFPTTIFRYDFISNETTTFRKPEIDFDPSEYETKQAFYNSKDGARVPMFITHKKGLELDGSNPALLYGYGGFNVNMTPYFSISNLIWLEKGGVYIVANLRGGEEYGEAWHQAGMLDKKQNVFDDFIAAGEWLIENKYTNKSKLAIDGASNGGLLVAACINQRPDLFGAALCQVPVIDMLRYHKFTVGSYWIPEYGNAETNPDHFKFLYAYSPLHNVKENIEYPPTLITTADTDDRVHPMHAKKFAATLQEKYKGQNPILLRVETKAGHGAGKPTTKRIEEYSDLYTFLFKTFRME